LAISDLIMRVYGFGPRHASHTIGKSSPSVGAFGALVPIEVIDMRGSQ
jgi:hypothetical protein